MFQPPLGGLGCDAHPVSRGRRGASISAGDISADQARAELLSIPVTLIVLIFAFGAVTAAVIPVLLALSAVAAGLGLLGPLSQVFPVEDSAKTVVLLIGMAVGVDYALFFVVRSRTERRRGASSEAALETTLRTSGRTVLLSGVTVAIAMAGMYLVGVRTLSGIATSRATTTRGSPRRRRRR
jgi:putative drug exporter of the RND superfamily